jgi:hypothetical protein
MPVITPTQLETQYNSPLTAEELAELELLYTRLNEQLALEYKELITEYIIDIESDTFSLYPERVTNQIYADIVAAGWSDTSEVMTYIIPTVTGSRELRGIQLRLLL